MKVNTKGCLVSIIWLLGCIITTFAQSQVKFETKDINKGVIRVGYKSSSGAKVKLMIEKDNEKYTYNLDSSGKLEAFPLQMGNGNYKISILENTTGSKYRLVKSESVKLGLDNPNQVYLSSIQNINWSTQMESIKKAKVLSEGMLKPQEKISGIYQYIIKGYKYNYNKLATLPTTYLPVLDKTYKEKDGICYDFSALYAGMLRSQGVPVKLVKGYSPNAEGYHAWNEVYNEKTGEWMIIDSTYDLQVIKNNKPVNVIKASKDYQKVNEY